MEALKIFKITEMKLIKSYFLPQSSHISMQAHKVLPCHGEITRKRFHYDYCHTHVWKQVFKDTAYFTTYENDTQ